MSKMSQATQEATLVDQMGKLNRSNNNDEDFININPSDTPESGRESRSSAFSSGLDSEEPCSSSSGRSSADGDQLQSNSKSQLKSKTNLIPANDQVHKIVDQVRVRFLDWCEHEKAADQFDPIDLAEMGKPLPDMNQYQQSTAFRWITRYFNFQQTLESSPEKLETDINKVVESVKELLKFRHQLQLNHARAEDFVQEIYLLCGIFPFGHDKQGMPVLYLRARVHRRWSSKLDDSLRRYCAWQIDQLTKSYPGAQVSKTAGKSSNFKDGSFGICFDCLSVSYACLDMDFLRYLVRILVQYYPSYCRYALSVDLPWLFRSVWKLVRSWLPEEAQSSVQLITSKQLTDFIDKDQIPNSQRINDLKAHEKPISCKHQLPTNYSNIAALADRAEELEVSTSELKQIKSHVDKVRKEYQQLGAL